MKKRKMNFLEKVYVIISFTLLVLESILLNIVPLNSMATGEIRYYYINHIIPAKIIFNIWYIILLFLFCFMLYVIEGIDNRYGKIAGDTMGKVSKLFLISSILHFLMILATHYEIILYSLMLNVALVFILFLISRQLTNTSVSRAENWFVKTPFSMYFGWMSYYVLINITSLIIKNKINIFGLDEHIWTIGIMAIGIFISFIIAKFNDLPAYSSIMILCSVGVGMNHIIVEGYLSPQYSIVIAACIVNIAMHAHVIGSAISNQ